MRSLLLYLMMIFALPASAYDPSDPLVVGHELPKEFQGVGVDEKLGSTIDLSLPFVSDTGQAVHLGEYFETGKPVLLAMVYYSCPNLCNFHLNGLSDAMKKLKWSPGQEFELVAVSMNPKEGPELAAKKKINYVNAYGRPQTINGWHFLTGQEKNIQALAKQIGFKYKWIEDQKQYAHTSVTYVVTPGGKISRLLYGIAPESQTLKLALVEASSGRIGNVVDQILLFCFHFDPGKNKYTLYAWNIMRFGGVAIVALLALFLIPVWRRAARSGVAA